MKWFGFIYDQKCGIMHRLFAEAEAVLMLRQKIKVYVLPLLLVLLGIVLQVLSETQLLDSLLSELVIEEKVAAVKTAVNILGYIAFVVPLGWQSVTRGKKAAACDATIARYINEQRELVFTILSEHKYVEGSPEDLNLKTKMIFIREELKENYLLPFPKMKDFVSKHIKKKDRCWRLKMPPKKSII